MSRQLLPGSWLNRISGSAERYPAWDVLVYNPRRVSIGEIATGQHTEPGKDLSPWVKTVSLHENVGFESGEDPGTTTAEFSFTRNPDAGEFRRGWIEDGCIVQVRQGDTRIKRTDWVVVFTGTFRGRPGDDPGTPSALKNSLQATAFGREERYLNQMVTTDSYPAGTDVGEIAIGIASQKMGLGQDEIMFGTQGFISQHVTTQIVGIVALEALWQLFFTVGKKPKFDSRGRLIAVDVTLDKPATRIWRTWDMVVSIKATPNEVETANKVALRGLDHNLTKIVQEVQLLNTATFTTGFFERSFDEDLYYSEDQTQRAEGTYVVEKKRIRWSDSDWFQVDEFHGTLKIDTRFLANVRLTIFIIYLVAEIAIAAVDYYFQASSGVVDIVVDIFTAGGADAILSAVRLVLKIISQVALAFLLWAMQFIGRGTYKVHGHPFEYVYQELLAEAQVIGLEPEEVRVAEYRNDLLSTIAVLSTAAKERLKRELLKNQLYTIVIIDDLALEVDDVVETPDGSRYYIITTDKQLEHGADPVINLTCWKLYDGPVGKIEHAMGV